MTLREFFLIGFACFTIGHTIGYIIGLKIFESIAIGAN